MSLHAAVVRSALWADVPFDLHAFLVGTVFIFNSRRYYPLNVSRCCTIHASLITPVSLPDALILAHFPLLAVLYIQYLKSPT